METLKKYFWLFSGLCTIAAFVIMCFLPTEWYFIAGIIVIIILAVLFAYFYGKNKSNQFQNELQLQGFLKEKYPIIEQCNNVGILNIISQKTNVEKNYPKMVEKLKNAAEIRIFHTTGHGFFHSRSNQSAIKNAIINNRAEVQVLIGQKKSPFLSSVEKIEKAAGERGSKSIHEEINDVEKTLNEIEKKISLRYVETEFRSSIVLIKGTEGNEWGWVTLTLPPFKAINSISFEIEKGNMYNDCIEHFKAVWTNASTESEYKKTNRKDS